MVQVTSKAPVNIESTLAITEGQAEAIKANRKRMKELCKDRHVWHTIAKDEDGNIVSTIGTQLDDRKEIEECIKELKVAHMEILSKLDTWEREMEDKQEENSSEQGESKEKSPLMTTADQVHNLVGDTPFCLLMLDEKGKLCISGTISLPIAASIITRYAFDENE